MLFDLRIQHAVGAGNSAFVRGFVQQRDVSVDITGHKNRCVSHLGRARVPVRPAAFVQLKSDILKVQICNIRLPSRRDQHLFENFIVLFAVLITKSQAYARILRNGFEHFGFQLQVQF